MPNKVKRRLDWQKLKVIAILGETGAGKTATAFKILDQFEGKKFVYNHPYPSILPRAGVSNLGKLVIHELSDCVVYIDEPQLTFVNRQDISSLLRIFSLARQKDVTIIVSTSDTRWLSVALEAYVDCWIIKNIDYDTIKRGSFIKKIIQKFLFNINPTDFRLEQNEAILYCRKFSNQPEKIQISLPDYYDEHFSQAYKFASGSMESEVYPLFE